MYTQHKTGKRLFRKCYLQKRDQINPSQSTVYINQYTELQNTA